MQDGLYYCLIPQAIHQRGKTLRRYNIDTVGLATDREKLTVSSASHKMIFIINKDQGPQAVGTRTHQSGHNGGLKIQLQISTDYFGQILILFRVHAQYYYFTMIDQVVETRKVQFLLRRAKRPPDIRISGKCRRHAGNFAFDDIAHPLITLFKFVSEKIPHRDIGLQFLRTEQAGPLFARQLRQMALIFFPADQPVNVLESHIPAMHQPGQLNGFRDHEFRLVEPIGIMVFTNTEGLQNDPEPVGEHLRAQQRLVQGIVAVLTTNFNNDHVLHPASRVLPGLRHELQHLITIVALDIQDQNPGFALRIIRPVMQKLSGVAV